MTAAARKWVMRNAPVKGAAANAVLRELAFAAVDDVGHGARRRQQQLVDATKLSRRTVQRALGELEELDLIRRHSGERTHCDQCRRAGRGVVVFDVVIPETIEDLHPGQMTMLTGATTGATVTPVAKGDQRHHDAGTGVTTALLNDSTTRSTAKDPSLKGSPFDESARRDRPPFEFRTAATERGGARVGAGRSRGRRGSRSPSDVGSVVRVAAPTPCALLGRDVSELVSLFELWDPIAERLQGAVPESTWSIWLAEVHPHALLDGRLVVGATESTAMWVNSRYGRLIREWASVTVGRPLGVEVASCLGAPAFAQPGAAA